MRVYELFLKISKKRLDYQRKPPLRTHDDEHFQISQPNFLFSVNYTMSIELELSPDPMSEDPTEFWKRRAPSSTVMRFKTKTPKEAVPDDKASSFLEILLSY